ncbi:MAG: hypothetical protein PPP55_07200 [Halorubrum sp.]
MVSTDDVKRALSTLATRTDTARRPYAAVIDEAAAARDDLSRAAGFVEAVGLDRLVEAIEDARRDGHDELAERGETALDSYRRFRTVTTDRVPASEPTTAPSAGCERKCRENPGTPKPCTD